MKKIADAAVWYDGQNEKTKRIVRKMIAEFIKLGFDFDEALRQVHALIIASK